MMTRMPTMSCAGERLPVAAIVSSCWTGVFGGNLLLAWGAARNAGSTRTPGSAARRDAQRSPRLRSSARPFRPCVVAGPAGGGACGGSAALVRLELRGATLAALVPSTVRTPPRRGRSPESKAAAKRWPTGTHAVIVRRLARHLRAAVAGRNALERAADGWKWYSAHRRVA